MKPPASGRVDGAGDRPTIGDGIISAAGVQIAIAAPHNHFTASPYGRVIVSGPRRVSGAGGRPTVGAGIIFPTGV